MSAAVVKTLCGSISQNPPSEPFATPTHNYYKALGDKAATHRYLDSKADKHCNNITKADRPDVTLSKKGIITSSFQAKVSLAKEM